MSKPKLSPETVQAMKENLEAWDAMSYDDAEDEHDLAQIKARDGFRFLLEQYLKGE